jgi:hypothetical protein
LRKRIVKPFIDDGPNFQVTPREGSRFFYLTRMKANIDEYARNIFRKVIDDFYRITPLTYAS